MVKNSKVSNFAKPCCHWIHGADFQTRTGDPILTMAPKPKNHRSELSPFQTDIFKIEAATDRIDAAMPTGRT